MLLTIHSDSAQTTWELGYLLGQNLPPGTVIAASGGLGAGKTVFAQGLAQGLDIAGPVTSPTYIYIQEYPGRLPFCHIDAYRLELVEEEEIAQLGLSECFMPGKTAYVEWPEFIRAFLPQELIELHFSEISGQPSERRLQFSFDERAQAWLLPLLLAPVERI